MTGELPLLSRGQGRRCIGEGIAKEGAKKIWGGDGVCEEGRLSYQRLRRAGGGGGERGCLLNKCDWVAREGIFFTRIAA